MKQVSDFLKDHNSSIGGNHHSILLFLHIALGFQDFLELKRFCKWIYPRDRPSKRQFNFEIVIRGNRMTINLLRYDSFSLLSFNLIF